MTSVTFENATIRDVIGKAGRIAPSKGAALDKASGIIMEVNVEDNSVIVKATNLQLSYMEVTDALMTEGATTAWRIPSFVIDGICSKLPIASGKSVTFSDDENPGAVLKISSGRMRASIRLIDMGYYPDWEAFDPSGLEQVSNFGDRIQAVAWAASKAGEPPLTGVHLSGEYAIATDHYKVAIIPCEAAPLYKPVTIPATIFTPLMKSMGDIRMGMVDNQLLVMPDDATQIRATIYGQDYPPVMKVFTREETATATFRRQGLTEIVERAMVMGKSDRLPLLKMIVGEEEIAVMMTDKDLGLLGDVLEVPGHAQHDRVTICFTPDNLLAAINNSPNDDITMHYRPELPLKPVRFDGGSGYEVLVMPRREVSEGE